MRRGLRAQLILTISLIVLLTIALISFLSNLFINIEFEKYAREQQRTRSDDIALSLAQQFNSMTSEWAVDYIHGIGMYALYDGYIIKLYDRSGHVVWDAENHDMTLCAHIMDEISARMEKERPHLEGGFVSREFDLKQNGQEVGRAVISYYGPYFLSESDFHFLDKLNLVLLVTGSFALLASLIAGGFLAKRIARPITRTAQIATEISEGNYGIRFEGKTRTRELDELVLAVNHMAAALDSQESLRKRLTADIAHELRTPLTAVAAHLEAMLQGVWEMTPERLKSCYEEIERLGKMVADLENLARLESEDFTLHRESVDLLQIAKAVGGNFELELQRKHFAFSVEGEPVVVPADRDRISQVVTNLLANAIKYTPEHGHIRIAARDFSNQCSLIVEDDGIGIPADELPFIFERFYRTDKSRSRKTGGAGIGLAVVKSIVTAHGGTVTAESSPEGGSRFTVTLPK